MKENQKSRESRGNDQDDTYHSDELGIFRISQRKVNLVLRPRESYIHYLPCLDRIIQWCRPKWDDKDSVGRLSIRAVDDDG